MDPGHGSGHPDPDASALGLGKSTPFFEQIGQTAPAGPGLDRAGIALLLRRKGHDAITLYEPEDGLLVSRRGR